RGLHFTAESIPVTDPRGMWPFRFDPGEHDRDAKTIFAGTPYEIRIPASTDPQDTGINDAIAVIDAMLARPSTAELICLKLVGLFGADRITHDSYHSHSAPDYLLDAVDGAIEAWNATDPKGNIATGMRAMLDPAVQGSAFWLHGAMRAKIR